MKEVRIQLDSIDKVKDFVAAASQFSSNIDLVEGRYIVDAKSILGIFSLDLVRPLTMQIEQDDEAPDIIAAMHRFLAEP